MFSGIRRLLALAIACYGVSRACAEPFVTDMEIVDAYGRMHDDTPAHNAIRAGDFNAYVSDAAYTVDEGVHIVFRCEARMFRRFLRHTTCTHDWSLIACLHNCKKVLKLLAHEDRNLVSEHCVASAIASRNYDLIDWLVGNNLPVDPSTTFYVCTRFNDTYLEDKWTMFYRKHVLTKLIFDAQRKNQSTEML